MAEAYACAGVRSLQQRELQANGNGSWDMQALRTQLLSDWCMA